jgi:hypothetical protein
LEIRVGYELIYDCPQQTPMQGNRVKKLCGDEACEEVVIPGGDFAAESEGILSPGSPD